jgi:hypothetical protein
MNMAAITTSLPRPALGCVALVLTFFAASCGGESAPSDIAKALDQKATTKGDAKSAEAMKALREKAEKEAAEAREAEIQKITTVGAPLPADIATACTEASASFDSFRQARLSGDSDALGRWNATKEPDLRKFTEACTATGKVEVAACMAKALREASTAMFADTASEELALRCKKRWGAEVVAQDAPAE